MNQQKLSVKCILELIDLLSYDDETLLYEQLKDRYKEYICDFYIPYCNVVVLLYARNTEDAFRKFLDSEEFKQHESKIRAYADFANENHRSMICKVCNNLEYPLKDHVQHIDQEQFEQYVRIKTNIDIN